MCGGKNYFPIERENWTLEKAPKLVTTPSKTLVIIIEWRRAHNALLKATPHAKNTREHKKRTKKKIDVVVLRANNTNEPNDDDLGAARTGIRDGEPGDGIPRGLVQQTRPLVLREMHR